MRTILRLTVATLAISPSAAFAQQVAPRPEVLTKLIDCRKLVDDIERVHCYDRQVAVLDDAERKRDVVVVDRAEIGRTRRSLFGLTLPNLRLFGRDEGEADQPTFSTIETKLVDAQRLGQGWVFTLEDGARWIQTDSVDLARAPKPGQSIRIRRGAMGSFLANVDKQLAVRVRRIN